MKVKVLKKTSMEIKIEIDGAGHSLCNLLQKRLLEDKDVDSAGYDVPHPLSYKPVIYVRTKGTVKPEEILIKAAEKGIEMSEDFSKKLEIALKKI